MAERVKNLSRNRPSLYPTLRGRDLPPRTGGVTGAGVGPGRQRGGALLPGGLGGRIPGGVYMQVMAARTPGAERASGAAIRGTITSFAPSLPRIARTETPSTTRTLGGGVSSPGMIRAAATGGGSSGIGVRTNSRGSGGSIKSSFPSSKLGGSNQFSTGAPAKVSGREIPAKVSTTAKTKPISEMSSLARFQPSGQVRTYKDQG